MEGERYEGCPLTGAGKGWWVGDIHVVWSTIEKQYVYDRLEVAEQMSRLRQKWSSENTVLMQRRTAVNRVLYEARLLYLG